MTKKWQNFYQGLKTGVFKGSQDLWRMSILVCILTDECFILDSPEKAKYGIHK